MHRAFGSLPGHSESKIAHKIERLVEAHPNILNSPSEIENIVKNIIVDEFGMGLERITLHQIILWA